MFAILCPTSPKAQPNGHHSNDRPGGDDRAVLIRSVFHALNTSGSSYLSAPEMRPLAELTGLFTRIQHISAQWFYVAQDLRLMRKGAMHVFNIFQVFLLSQGAGSISLFCVLNWAGFPVAQVHVRSKVSRAQTKNGEKSLTCWDRSAPKLHLKEIMMAKFGWGFNHVSKTYCIRVLGSPWHGYSNTNRKLM